MVERPFADKRSFGPFFFKDRNGGGGSSIEPEKRLIFKFEDEQWMIDSGSRDFHQSQLRGILRQPAGPTGKIIIRIKEKEWDDNKLVTEYEDEFPVTMLQIGMLDVIDFDDAVEAVIDIVSEYIEDNGGEYDEVYTTEV